MGLGRQFFRLWTDLARTTTGCEGKGAEVYCRTVDLGARRTIVSLRRGIPDFEPEEWDFDVWEENGGAAEEGVGRGDGEAEGVEGDRNGCGQRRWHFVGAKLYLSFV